LRSGDPLNIEKKVTAAGAKFFDRNYQVWQYPGDVRYVFIDIEMNGNYKLIYALHDPRESSLSDWQAYLGKKGTVQESELDVDPYLDQENSFIGNDRKLK
jgi:DUF971 family protein